MEEILRRLDPVFCTNHPIAIIHGLHKVANQEDGQARDDP